MLIGSELGPDTIRVVATSIRGEVLEMNQAALRSKEPDARPSIDAEDLFHGHIGGMDVAAKALLAAEQMLKDGGLDTALQTRYAGWQGGLGQGDPRRQVRACEARRRRLPVL